MTVSEFTGMFARKVREFMADVVGMGVPATPTRLTRERKAFASKFLAEELKEFEDADCIEDEADALVDLAYVAVGRLLEMGVDPSAAVSAVHEANMRKRRGSTSRGSEDDAAKPEGWLPPDWGKALDSRVSCYHLADSTLPGDNLSDAPCGSCGLFFTDEPPLSTDEQPRNGGFVKYDSDKDCRPELVPAPFLWELGRLFAAGARKYAAENWRRGRDPQRYLGALERHVLAWRMGELEDPQTRVHHLVCAAWNACALFMAQLEHGDELGELPDSCTEYRRDR